MRLLLLCSARQWGGNEKWTAMAAEVLAARHEVHIAYRAEAVGERFRALDGIEAARWPFLAGADPWTLARLIRYIRHHRIDVLLPTRRKDYLLAGLAARRTGACNVLRLGIVRELHPWSHHRWIYGRWADGMIVNAERIRERALASGLLRPEQVAVVPNGVDRARLEAAAARASEPPFGFTLVTAGKLTARKDLATLLRGFAGFRSAHPEAGLVIIGEGPERPRLAALAEALGVADGVVFRGFEQDPYPSLASAHVFVTTSRNEGFANTVIEALHLRLPVITTAAGGALQWLRSGHECLGIPMGDPAALCDALASLYHDPARAEAIAASGARRAQALFATERLGQRLEGFLEDRLKSR